MSTDHSWIALWLDAPLQSWGFESRFERRHTAMFPSKSGVIGLICAAMGAPKGSDREREVLAAFANHGMVALRIPRLAQVWREGQPRERPIRRLTDFHTVAFTRAAGANPSRVKTLDAKFHQPISAVDRGKQMTPTWRDYLLDARFIVLLPVAAGFAAEVARALRDPVWGVWLGRKACVPSSPILVLAHDVPDHDGVFSDKDAARKAALALAAELDGPNRALPVDSPEASFARVEDADFASGTDTHNDTPLSFGTAESSGVEGRQFAPRRVNVIPASPEAAQETRARRVRTMTTLPARATRAS